jgi:hypothetical protein
MAGGTVGTGGTVGAGGTATLGSLSSGGRTAGPQDALDAPVDIAIRPDAGRAADAKVDTNPSSVGPDRCASLQLGLGRASQDAVIVDVDGDGRLDLVTAEANSHLAIYRQTAARTFAEPDVYDWPGKMNGRAVAAADLNQDSVLDFAMADASGDTGLLLSAAGGKRQTTVLSTALAVEQLDIAIADFDRDGHPDILVPNYEQDVLGFWWGNGPGTFLPRADQTTCQAPAKVLVIDANEDGLPDLFVACRQSASRVLINKGDRTFASTTLYLTSDVSAVAAGDTNRDGHIDLMLADVTYRKVMILLGDGKGGFTQPSGLIAKADITPINAAAGDFDHDGNLDFVLGNLDDAKVSIYLGTGDGHFQPEPYKTVALTRGAVSLTAGDIDGDGYDDFVATQGRDGPTLVFGPCP